MPVRARPLSPHLLIYRWQIGNTLSILHRFTGAALSLGLIALVGWLVALASGESTYASALRLFGSPVGKLALLGWIFTVSNPPEKRASLLARELGSPGAVKTDGVTARPTRRSILNQVASLARLEDA